MEPVDDELAVSLVPKGQDLTRSRREWAGVDCDLGSDREQRSHTSGGQAAAEEDPSSPLDDLSDEVGGYERSRLRLASHSRSLRPARGRS
jgi:hypothetical protein